MKNFALIRQGAGNAVLKEIPIPKLREDYILVRTVAVAINPTDWTTLDAPGDDGTIVGCDYSGIVEEVGKAVTKSFKKGDRIAGFAHGANDANPENGAFARYIAVKGDVQLHIPDGVSFEAAATVGVGIGTSLYALYNLLKLPPPDGRSSTGEPILIYGGSTATGTIAIQFAKLSGRKVLTTASPKHFDLVKDRGADEVYDYRSPDCGSEIYKATNGQLVDVLDTVSLESTAAISAAAIGPQGGNYMNLLGIDCPRTDVESTFFLGYAMSGEEYIYEAEKYAAEPEAFVFASKWYSIADEIWAEGKIKPHPQKVGSDGLLGAIDGMKQMKEGKVSGVKLVYRVEDTDWPEA